jgi:hypothetical protein
MPLVTVPISPAARARLRELAAAERRTPRQQAAIILERALASGDDLPSADQTALRAELPR